MRLINLTVEDGFLRGLDLQFGAGLNVLIGPRGVGKTSIIELIRFCLNSPAYTREDDREAVQHALSVLGGGRATLTVDIDGEQVVFTRAADEHPAHRIPPVNGPIIVSQNEIEKLGLDGKGRLRLIDDFIDGLEEVTRREGALLGEVASATQELRSISEAIVSLQQTTLDNADVEDKLEAATTEQENALKSFTELQPERDQLNALDERLVALQARRGALARAVAEIAEWDRELSVVADEMPTLPSWPGEAGGPNLLNDAKRGLNEVSRQLDSTSDEVTEVLEALRGRLAEIEAAYTDTADQSRSLRTKLEAAQHGAGTLSQQISALRQRLQARYAAERDLAAGRTALADRQAKRKGLLDETDELRASRFNLRKAQARRLNALLAPHVRIEVTRYGLTSGYADVIAGALRGSNLKYSALAPEIAKRMPPRELAEAAEGNDSGAIARVARIADERAARVAERLREAGTEQILRAPVEDSVGLSLLDGPDYKPSPQLSTGQRCTTVLPILLTHAERSVVIDQPEDHLDNAYIADTVARTLRRMNGQSQLVISTHNANIPVLGEADRVTLLGSDGSRGFVECSDGLDSPEIVQAITRVMEGGAAAFQARATYYRGLADD